MAKVLARTLGAPFTALALLAFGAGCATMLPTLPPSPTYGSAEAPAPNLTRQQRSMVDGVNVELAKLGLPPATPGAFEMNAAALIANAAFTKHGAGTNATSRGTNLGGAIDEGEGTESKIHSKQRLLAAGMTDDLGATYFIEDYPQRELKPDEIAQAVIALRPTSILGKLRVGVANVTNGWDNHRMFGLVLRDEAVDLLKGPPRKAVPGSSFALAGTLRFQPDHGQVALAVERPDGTVDRRELPVAADGAFEATYQLPANTGLYVVSLGGTTLSLPVFVGVEPTPWPPSSPADADAPDTALAAAKAVAKAVEGFRKQRRLPSLPIATDLCALAKAHAKTFSGAVQDGKGDVKAFGSAAERLLAAGLDPKKSTEFQWRVVAESFADWAARAPWDAFEAQALGSTEASSIGIGVVKEPKRSPDDKAVFDITVITLQGTGKSAAR